MNILLTKYKYIKINKILNFNYLIQDAIFKFALQVLSRLVVENLCLLKKRSYLINFFSVLK